MTERVDLAVATPAFLDLTFVGLERLPAAGEEEHAADLLRSPGGGAITATGAARLGLTTALATPVGDDETGRLISEALAREGVRTFIEPGLQTAVTVAMPVGTERAFVTFDPGTRATPGAIAAIAPRAVVADLADLDLTAPGARAYVGCGDASARRFAGQLPAASHRPRALIVNEREAGLLSGSESSRRAAERLAEFAEVVVVTRGASGALAIAGSTVFETFGVDIGPVADTIGAGDLFTAAFVWADLLGMDAGDCVRWAVLAATLSVTEATGIAGAVSERRLMDEGRTQGLAVPEAAPRVTS